MEGDDDELEDLDCLPRLLEDIQSVPRCIVILCTAAAFIRGRHLFHSAPPIVRRLFEGGVYSRKYGTCHLTLTRMHIQISRICTSHVTVDFGSL